MANRFWGQLLDAFIPGNAFNEVRGTWNPATSRVGLMSMGAGQLAPGGGYLVQKGAERGWFGDALARQLLGEHVSDSISNQWNQVRQDMRGQFGHVEVPNLGVTTPWRPTMMTGGTSSNDPNVDLANTRLNDRMNNTQAGIQRQIDAAAGGGGGGSSARPIGGMLSFSGGRSGYNNGVGAGTGFGATNYQNDSWGNTAAGFGIGATSSGSGGNFALADAIRSAKLNRV